MSDNNISRITFKNGDVYEGKIINGMMACGTYKYADGSAYVGDFTNNIPDVWGKYTWVNGSSYEGQFMEGIMRGDGEFIHYNKQYRISARFTDWEFIINKMVLSDRFYYTFPGTFYYRIPDANSTLHYNL